MKTVLGGIFLFAAIGVGIIAFVNFNSKHFWQIVSFAQTLMLIALLLLFTNENH